jgi:probable F420-dependent oxidoreductase
LRFGVIYSRLHDVVPPAEFSRLVEELGFDAVWATEGLVNQLAQLDPLITMAELARGTDRITVGSCVILLPLRNAAILAKEVVSLDVFSGGRIVVGVGVGGSGVSQAADFQVSGVDPAERGARCDEAIEVMKLLWTQETASYHGRFYDFDDIAMEPKPRQRPHPPIWIGGNAPATARRAARFADGFVPIGEGPERFRELCAPLPAHVTRAVHVYYGPSREAAERTLTKRYGFPVSFEDGRFLFGSDDDCARLIEQYAEAGVEEFVLNTATPLSDVRARIEGFAERVLPKFG